MQTNRPVLFGADQLVQPDGASLSYITVTIATKWCYVLKKYDGATILIALAPDMELDSPTEYECWIFFYHLSNWQWRVWLQMDLNHRNLNTFQINGHLLDYWKNLFRRVSHGLCLQNPSKEIWAYKVTKETIMKRWEYNQSKRFTY